MSIRLHLWNSLLAYLRRGTRRPARSEPRRTFRPSIEELDQRLTPSTLTVNSLANSNLRDSVLTLREAINLANGSLAFASLTGAERSQVTSGLPAAGQLDVIAFAIPGTGPFTISPTSALPDITDPVILDGTTQPGYAGRPLIELNGARAGAGVDGLRILGGGSTVKGLVINGFQGDGIELAVKGGNKLLSSYIGIDRTGKLDQGNVGAGVHIRNTTGNVIGEPVVGSGNVISGNDFAGIWIEGSDASGNTVQRNHIGTDYSGTAALGNGSAGQAYGVFLDNAPRNIIGGTTPGARNVISGQATSSSAASVAIIGTGATGNLVLGNLIGTDLNGKKGVANQTGVLIQNAAGNIVGGTTARARNIISGNTLAGVRISGNGAWGNHVLGNFIGTDSAGTVALPNARGVFVSDAPRNTIGGTDADDGAVDGRVASRNLISGNTYAGVEIRGSTATGNLVEGNYIGTDVTGTLALGNSTGVRIQASSGNSVGGIAAGAGNVISGNTVDGVRIEAVPADPPGMPVVQQANNNQVQGNFIGTQAGGQAALPNGANGVVITALTRNNTIGGIVAGAGNIIAFNGGAGVRVGGTGNSILGNSIHSNAGLGIDLGPDGVTANDVRDGDGGANGLQNFPELRSAFLSTLTAGPVQIVGVLDSTSGHRFRIEFFASGARDPSGFGEGRTFLGAVNVTGGAGPVSFVFRGGMVAAGQWITATATDLDTGDTSEFSRAVVVEAAVIQ